MKYIIHRHLNHKVMCGLVDMIAGAPCEEHDGIIWFDEYPLCAVTSHDAHQYFARDDDGQGLRRGKLTQMIQHRLEEKDDGYQDRWDKIWDDKLCQNYRRIEFEDHWLWNHDFYNAEIVTLLYIAGLIGLKEED